MKKIISIVLSLSLLLGTLSVLTFMNIFATSTNVFTNGDFEDSSKTTVKGGTSGDSSVTDNVYDCDNWYRSGFGGTSTQYYTSEKKNGNASLRLWLGSSYGYAGGKFFKNFNVEKNTSYTISFWYYVPSASSVTGAVKTTAAIDPEDTPSTSNILTFGDATNTTYTLTWGSMTEWKQYTNTFNSGDNEVLRLAFRLKAKSGTELNTYIDDIVIEENVAPSVFTNGDFEDSTLKKVLKAADYPTTKDTDLDNWYRHTYGGDSLQYSTADKHTGTGSLQLFANGGYNGYNNPFTKNFAVNKNTNYKISFWYKVTSNSTVRGAVATVPTTDPTSSTGIILGFGKSTNTTSVLSYGATDGWQEYTETFESGDNEILRILFRLDKASVNTEMFIDDIVITETEGTPYNGSLEYGDSDWSINSNHAIVDTQASAGTYSLKLSGEDAAKSYFKLETEKNKDYIITFDYLTVAGNDNNKWGIRNADGGGSLETGAEGLLAGGSLTEATTQWTTAYDRVNSGDCEELYIAFRSSADGEYYIDNILIEEVFTVNIPNGDFEDGTKYWTINSKHSVSDVKPYAGVNSLRIGGGNYTKSFVEFSVNRYTDYKILIKYNAVKTTGSDKWGVRAAPGDGSLDTGAKGLIFTNKFTTTTDWESAVVSFNSGSNKTLYFTLQGMLNTEVYIDDIYLMAADGSLIVNGDFESGLSAWNANSENYNATTDEHDGDGTSSMHASGGYYSVANQMTALEVDTNYKLTFRYKGSFNGTVLNYGVSNSSNFEESNLIYSSKLQSVDDWTTESVVFNSGSGGADVITKAVYILFQCAEGNDFYIDNVVLEKTDEATQPAAAGVSPKYIEFQTKERYVSYSDKNLISQNGFEDTTDAAWNIDSFMAGGTLSVVDASLRPNKLIDNNSKILKFEAHGLVKQQWNAFYVNVEPNTDYYFTTWVLGEYFDADTNTNDMTFGIINANSGYFLAPTTGNSAKIYTKTSGMTPPTWDEAWHLVGMKFNSGTATQIGIAIVGANSVAYFDDMYVVKATEADKYVNLYDRIDNENPMKISNLEPSNTDCDEADNLIENYDLSQSDISFYEEGLVYGVNVNVKDSTGTKGNSLHYKTSSRVPSRAYYIKWVDVDKNTDYTFSAILQAVEEGDAFVGLITDNRKLPSLVKSWAINSENYDENCTWKEIAVSFYSGGYDRVGFVICDKGGELFLDNIKLFETANGKKATPIDDGFPTTITSSTYSTTNDILGKIPAGTKLSTILSKLDNSQYIRAFNENGDEITDKNTVIGTGVELRLMDGYEIKDRITVVINGDVDSDGLVTKKDSSIILKYLTKQVELSRFAELAADTDNDKSISINDAAIINAVSVGKATLQLKSY